MCWKRWVNIIWRSLSMRKPLPSSQTLRSCIPGSVRTIAVSRFDLATTQGEEAARPVYERSLEYFDKVVRINEQINVKDPGPHLSIARTYSQLGEFFIAARNVQTALEYEPTNADIYGQLGVIYFRSRNYEGSIYSLQCAIYGCSGEESCLGRGLDRCFPDLGENPVTVQGLPISTEHDCLLLYLRLGAGCLEPPA